MHPGLVLVVQRLRVNPLLPVAAAQAFEQEMRNGNVDWQLIVYGGAIHIGEIRLCRFSPVSGRNTGRMTYTIIRLTALMS
jgi:hypothetical protein